MRLRFILAILILLLACSLQFWFASANVFVNFILAALIVFAFFFDFWEMLVFVLFAVFVVNWAPAPSVDIVVFGLIPLAAFAFHKAFRWSRWAGAPVAIVAGFLLLYLAIAPAAFLPGWESFLTDLFGGLVFGALVFFTMDRLALP
ncbi:MAG TPA: hypothetical protein VMA75_02090 [Candidatus Paceibacterota bacterium]|nr:hypothetical protein [Candidatus Paceibacterota bacterium]